MSEPISFRRAVIGGLLYSLVTAMVGIILLSLVVQARDLSGQSLVKGIFMLNMVAGLIGAFFAARKAASRGWYYGMLTSVLYACLVLFLGLLFGHAAFNANTLLQLLLLAGIGAFGGMLGVSTLPAHRK